MIVLLLVFAPAFTLALLLTITLVSGSPPISPLVKLPNPCATSSLFGGVTLLIGSNLSTASIPNSVSKEATIANVSPLIQTSALVI
jgi:hypothetical protein